jgi:methionyl-tRNA synthetase
MLARYREGAVPDAEPDPALQPDFEGLAERVGAQLDDVQVTAALDAVWQRVRRLNRYVEERAPWQLAKDEARARDLDVTLRSLAEGLRVVAVLLHPYMPATTTRLLEALGQPGLALGGARYGAAPGGARVERLDALFPKAPAER